jgi:hypothetical protein
MRTWIKVTLGVGALLALAFGTLAGTGAYFFFRNFEQQPAAEAESTKTIDAVRARFGTRPPLVEIVNPARGDVRINRPAVSATAPVTTVHVLNWKGEDSELTSAQLPLWLMRFSSVNIASQLGVAPEKFRLTVDDIKRYGPGIIVDYASPGASRTLVWVE